MTLSLLLAALSLLALITATWWYVYSSILTNDNFFLFLCLLFGYPTVVLFLTGLYKWKDDRWRISGVVRAAIAIGTTIIIAIFIAIAICQ